MQKIEDLQRLSQLLVLDYGYQRNPYDRFAFHKYFIRQGTGLGTFERR